MLGIYTRLLKEGRKAGRHPMRENDGSIYLTRRVGKVTKTQNLADSKIFPRLSDAKCAWISGLAAAAAVRPDR